MAWQAFASDLYVYRTFLHERIGFSCLCLTCSTFLPHYYILVLRSVSSKRNLLIFISGIVPLAPRPYIYEMHRNNTLFPRKKTLHAFSTNIMKVEQLAVPPPASQPQECNIRKTILADRLFGTMFK